MADLFPGMTIEVSTIYSSEDFALATGTAPRPKWLSDDATWPPVSYGVMYRIADAKGVCDRCALTCEDEIEKTRGSHRAVDRGDSSWWCTCHASRHDGNRCRRWWDGSTYRENERGY